MKRSPFFALLILALSPAAVCAQTSSPAAPPTVSAPDPTLVDSEKEAAIRKLIEVTGGRNMAQQSMTQMISLSRSTLMNSCGDNVKCQQLGNLLMAKMDSGLKAHIDELVSILIPVYAHHYSLDEINALIQFYQSPLGQKVILATPQVSMEIQKSSYAMGQKIGADALKEVLKEHPELAPSGPPPAPAAH